MLDIKFKDFAIDIPHYIDNRKPNSNEYNVVKQNNNGTGFVIAKFYWDSKETCWEFKSIGTRYLEYYSEGLNEWLLKVMNMLECSIRAEDIDD